MRTVCGIAINDSPDRVNIGKRGANVLMPEYKMWHNMIHRVYGTKVSDCYESVSVCEDWLRFSRFKGWLDGKDLVGKALDKDLLYPWSKIYSPDTCSLLSQRLNSIISVKKTGELPIGCCYVKRNRNYLSYINDNSRVHLGVTKTPLEAHRLWQKAKLNVLISQTEGVTEYSVKKRLEEICELLRLDIEEYNETILINRKFANNL